MDCDQNRSFDVKVGNMILYLLTWLLLSLNKQKEKWVTSCLEWLLLRIWSIKSNLLLKSAPLNDCSSEEEEVCSLAPTLTHTPSARRPEPQSQSDGQPESSQAETPSGCPRRSNRGSTLCSNVQTFEWPEERKEERASLQQMGTEKCATRKSFQLSVLEQLPITQQENKNSWLYCWKIHCF